MHPLLLHLRQAAPHRDTVRRQVDYNIYPPPPPPSFLNFNHPPTTVTADMTGVVSSPDPTYKRGSGDIWPIPLASLTLITFWREISLRQSHCRKHNLQYNTGNPWILQHDDIALFSSQLCIQQAINF